MSSPSETMKPMARCDGSGFRHAAVVVHIRLLRCIAASGAGTQRSRDSWWSGVCGGHV